MYLCELGFLAPTEDVIVKEVAPTCLLLICLNLSSPTIFRVINPNLELKLILK